ncbi:hypothetical protein ACOEKA_004688 [Vibrio parahaemolyticus]
MECSICHSTNFRSRFV